MMKHILSILGCLAFLSFFSTISFAQGSEEAHRHSQFPHPLNATMGIPDPVGSYNIRLNGFRQVHDSQVTYDFSGHLSYGMFEWGGIHLRSLGVKTTPLTEVIGMVGLWRNQRKTQGVSLLGIVGIPTGKKKEGEHHGLAYLAGFTARLASENVVTNDVILHYDFTAKHYIAETGSVVRLREGLFTTLDVRGTFGSDPPNISLLTSIKSRIASGLFIALAYHGPATSGRTFTHQIFTQLEIGGH